MKIKVGVIGYGYWGPNIVRNFHTQPEMIVKAIADIDQGALKRAGQQYPDIKNFKDPKAVIESPDVDVVAVVTPVSTHYDLAKKALEAGKHIFVEKPFTATTAQADELIELAEKKKLQIMVDHTFLFTGAVRKMKELIAKKELGEILYFDSTRINLGLFQHDVNVIWDLAPHDFSIMDYVIDKKLKGVSAHGMAHVQKKIENVAYITLYAEEKEKFIAHFNINWLSPVKVRTMLIGGDKKMLIWDDLVADEKIKVYDRGVDIDSKEGVHKLLVAYRSGDAYIPKIEHTEALNLEMRHFFECLTGNKKPINDGLAGRRVVKLLECSEKSIRNQGKYIEI